MNRLRVAGAIETFWNWPFLTALAIAFSIAGYSFHRIEWAVASAAVFVALLWRLRPNILQFFFVAAPALPVVALPLSKANMGYAPPLAFAVLLAWTCLVCSVWKTNVTRGPMIAGSLAAAAAASLFFLAPNSTTVTPKPPIPAAPAPVAGDPSDPQSQFVLALKYRNGDGVDKDDARALGLATRAASQGYAPALTLAGMMYQNGEGVAADPYIAAAYFLKAADQGDPWAQSTLGGMYLGGVGVEQDNVLAYKWLSRAAAQGNASARSLLEAAQDTFTEEERAEGEAKAAPDALQNEGAAEAQSATEQTIE